jgi:phage regulator Rha-like protein
MLDLFMKDFYTGDITIGNETCRHEDGVFNLTEFYTKFNVSHADNDEKLILGDVDINIAELRDLPPFFQHYENPENGVVQEICNSHYLLVLTHGTPLYDTLITLFYPALQLDEITMSTLEVAELTGKRHGHVIRDLEIMLGELNITLEDAWDGDTVNGSVRIKSDVRRKWGESIEDSKVLRYDLTNELTLTLLTGYDVKLREVMLANMLVTGKLLTYLGISNDTDKVTTPSLSTLEIAELTGKRHDNVIRDVEDMLKIVSGQKTTLPSDLRARLAPALHQPQGDIDQKTTVNPDLRALLPYALYLAMGEINTQYSSDTYLDNQDKHRPLYKLSPFLTLLLVTGYNVVHRNACVKVLRDNLSTMDYYDIPRWDINYKGTSLDYSRLMYKSFVERDGVGYTGRQFLSMKFNHIPMKPVTTKFVEFAMEQGVKPIGTRPSTAYKNFNTYRKEDLERMWSMLNGEYPFIGYKDRRSYKA